MGNCCLCRKFAIYKYSKENICGIANIVKKISIMKD